MRCRARFEHLVVADSRVTKPQSSFPLISLVRALRRPLSADEEEVRWRKVKERFLFSLTNLGQPIVHVQDANYGNRGELYLIHKFEGVPLDVDKARDTLKNLQRLWRRPVHLETVEDERGRLLSYDGAEHKNVRL